MIQERTDIEINLEELLDGEVRCESIHADPAAGPCSIQVVARKLVACEHAAINICARSAAWNERVIAAQDFTCDACESPVADCWRVIPI